MTQSGLLTKFKERESARAALHHRKAIVVILVIFAIGSIFLTPMLYGERFSEIEGIELLDTYHSYPVQISPDAEGEIWQLDGQLRVFGRINITAPTYIDSVYIPNLFSRSFVNGNVTIDIARLKSGLQSIELRSENYTIYIQVYVSNTNLLQFKVTNYLTAASLFLFILIGSVPLCECFIMGPGWKYLVARAYKEELLEVNLGIKDWESSIHQTEQVIRHLSGRTDYYKDQKASLLTTIGLMLGACLGLITLLATANIDPVVSTPIIMYDVLTIIVLMWPIQQLHASNTDHFLPSTSWFYRGMITGETPSKHSFAYDLNRNYYILAGRDGHAVFIDNLKEVVSLYYILRNTKEHYSAAQKGVGYAALNLVSGFILVMILLLDLGDILVTAALGFLVISLALVVILSHASWWLDDMTIRVHTLFYNPDAVDSQTGKVVEDLLNRIDEDTMRVIPTCGFNEVLKHNQLQEIEKQSAISMAKLGLKQYKFSQPNQFGTEIPVLVIKTFGRNESTIIYPHYRDDNGQRVEIGIRNYIEEM